MKVEVSMTNDESKFHQNSWWATSPDFVLHALSAQLKAASVIWPELEKYSIGISVKSLPKKSDGASHEA